MDHPWYRSSHGMYILFPCFEKYVIHIEIRVPLAKHYWVNSCNIMISSFTPSTSMPSLFSHNLVRPRILCLHGWRTVSYNKFELNSSYLLIWFHRDYCILSYHSSLWSALINRVVIILSMQRQHYAITRTWMLFSSQLLIPPKVLLTLE